MSEPYWPSYVFPQDQQLQDQQPQPHPMSPYIPAPIAKRPRPRYDGDDEVEDDDLPIHIPRIGNIPGGEMHGTRGAESIGASSSRHLPIAQPPSFGRGQYGGPVGMEGSPYRLESYPGITLGGPNLAAGVHEMAHKLGGQWGDQSPFSPPSYLGGPNPAAGVHQMARKLEVQWGDQSPFSPPIHPGTALGGPNPAAWAGPVGMAGTVNHLNSHPGITLGGPNPAAGVHGMTRKLEGQRIDHPTFPSPPNSTLFVEGLPVSCSKREAAHIFRPFFGFKNLRIVKKEYKFGGRGRYLLCFVEFTDPLFAAHAINVLQGYKFDIGDPASPCLKLRFAHDDKSGVFNRGYR